MWLSADLKGSTSVLDDLAGSTSVYRVILKGLQVNLEGLGVVNL